MPRVRSLTPSYAILSQWTQLLPGQTFTCNPLGNPPPRANQSLLSNQTFENIPYDDPDPDPPTKTLNKSVDDKAYPHLKTNITTLPSYPK